MKSLDQKFKYFNKNGYLGALIPYKIELFNYLKYNFKTSRPQKMSIFKLLYDKQKHSYFVDLKKAFNFF